MTARLVFQKLEAALIEARWPVRLPDRNSVLEPFVSRLRVDEAPPGSRRR